MAFADLPIRRKIQALVLITSGCVLLLTCTIFVTYDLLTFRRDLTRELETMAEVLASNSSAALAFGAKDEATELLAALAADSDITSAALYDRTGAVFASYAPQGKQPPPSLAVRPSHIEFSGGRVAALQPVVQRTRVLGMLYVESNLGKWYRRLWFYGGVVLGVLGLALITTVLVSSTLRKSITVPVEELASVARIVSLQADYSVRATRVSQDELGQLTSAFNQMLAQIQERDEKLRESEERLRLALDAADMGIWRLDPTRNLTTRDANLSRLLGLPPVTAVQPLEDYIERVLPEDRDYVQSTMSHALHERGDLQLEYRIQRPDGSIHWLRTRGRVLTATDGSVICLTGASFDITDRKASEEEVRRLNLDLEQRVVERTAELEQANRDLESFTYSVSHDLRSPLRTLSGFAELLLLDYGPVLPPEATAHAERLVHGAHRMGRLIDDLLNFSRLGRHPLVTQQVELERLVDDVLPELQPDLAGRKVEWRRSALPTVSGDPGLLRQVLANLLGNAIKYSRRRDPAIISIGIDQRDGTSYVVIRDNGVGFDMRDREKLFRVFERLHRSAEFEGTGVGLAIVARIIRRHGGTIFAEARPNEGAAFFFHLPGM